MATTEKKTWSSIAAILAAIGASVCCVGPLFLLSIGVGGAWVSTLTSFESVRPIFIILTIFFVFLTYRRLYLVPQKCDENKPCALAKKDKGQKVSFWIGAIFIFLLLAFPWYAPYFME